MSVATESPQERFLAQRRAAGLTEDPMWCVYILELKIDLDCVPKFYVGHTSRLQRRIHDHMCSKTVAWVKRFGVKSVLRVFRTCEEDALGLEVAKATELKAKHGWQNVRGGVDNNAGESPLPHYWAAPAQGLSPRARSRSPAGNILPKENHDDREGVS